MVNAFPIFLMSVHTSPTPFLVIKEINNNTNNESNNTNATDKRFKTLPAAETLPRNEVLGGYIFVCNNDTMQEDLKRQLFGVCLLVIK